MRKLNIPILQSLIALGTGIVLYDYYRISLGMTVVTVAISSSLLALLHHYARKKIFSEMPFITVLFALFVILGYLTRERSNDLNTPEHYIHKRDGDVHTLLFSIKDKLKPTVYQEKYVIQIRAIDNKNASGLALLNLQKDSLATLQEGEWYYARSPILEVPKTQNPFQFDYGNYLKHQEIYGQLSLGYEELLQSSKTSDGFGVWSSRFRESVQHALRSYSFSSQQLAIIEALVLGQKQGIDKEMSSQYAAAGMMHILAVSGLHVGIILLLLRLLLKPIRQYHLKWFKSGLIILLIWSFAFITGLSPSVMRAATMFTFLEIGNALGGRRKSKDAVLVSAMLLLLYNPLLLYQVGFQLSYLAVLAILWIQPWLEKFWTPKFWILRYLWGIATVTIAAQIGVMPLSLFYFHQFPGLFFISNIVVLPFLGIILGGGIMVSGLAVIGWLPQWLVAGYGGIIDLMNGFIGWVASQESFVSKHISISLALLIASYVLMVTILSLFKKMTSTRYLIASTAVVLFTGIWMYEKYHPLVSHHAILNKNRATYVVSYHNKNLHVQTNDTLFDLETDYRINAYRDALHIKYITQDTLSNYYSFNGKQVLLIDELGIYKVSNAQPHYILLTQSPRLNLDRLITTYPEAVIIADASNYKSFVDHWRTTCLQRKIPFHSTYEKGAYIIN